MIAAAFVLILQTFGGLTVTVEAVSDDACRRAERVLLRQMRASSLGFVVVRACPVDPDAPVSAEPAPARTDSP